MALNEVSLCAGVLMPPSAELKVVQKRVKKADFMILNLSYDSRGARRIPIKWLRSIGVQTVVTVLVDYYERDRVLEECFYRLAGLNPDPQTDIVEKLDQNLRLASLDFTRAFVKQAGILFCLGPSDVGGPDFLVQLGF